MNLPLVLLNRRRRGGLDAYREGGFNPALVFDFDDEYYRTGGTSTTFSSAITHSRTTNATMVDSDGLLKWGPHNLALNSAAPATQNITVVSGADYTVECTGVSIALSGAGTGTVTEGNPVTITASTTTLTLTVTGSTGTMWAYRSDLGGMVNNPDRGDSYVPTTSSARYLARRGHHIYNGTAWVNEGMLHESESRVNFAEDSSFDDDTAWAGVGITGTSATGITSPDGSTSKVELLTSNGTTNARYFTTTPTLTAENYTWSGFFKAATHDVIALSLSVVGDFTDRYVWFNLTSGEKGTVGADILDSGIEPYGNGWYRCWIMNLGSAFIFYPRVHIFDSDGTTASTSGDSVYAYGAQLEAGPTPSSYIPTSGATVTRAADTLTVPSANLPWSSDAVSIQMQGRATGDTYTTTRWYLDANNYITQEINSSDFTFEQAASGTVDAVTGGSFTSGVNTPFNFASTHASTLVAAAVGGTALTDNTTPVALPNLSATDLNLGHSFMGTLKLMRVWSANITEAGREEAST